MVFFVWISMGVLSGFPLYIPFHTDLWPPYRNAFPADGFRYLPDG